MKNPSKTFVPLADPASFHRRLKSRRHIIKSFEAEANNNRTTAEKLADIMTARLGSVVFLLCNILFFSTWILINTRILPIVEPFDPFPLPFLTTLVSLEAIFLAIIVLISQNRASKIDDLRDEMNLQIATIAEEEITKMMELQLLMLKKQGIDVSADEELQEMLEPKDQLEIEKMLEKQLL